MEVIQYAHEKISMLGFRNLYLLLEISSAQSPTDPVTRMKKLRKKFADFSIQGSGF
jgi:hypothetical protein